MICIATAISAIGAGAASANPTYTCAAGDCTLAHWVHIPVGSAGGVAATNSVLTGPGKAKAGSGATQYNLIYATWAAAEAGTDSGATTAMLEAGAIEPVGSAYGRLTASSDPGCTRVRGEAGDWTPLAAAAVRTGACGTAIDTEPPVLP